MYPKNEKELLKKLDRFEREMNEVNKRQTNQMTKLKEEFDKEMTDAKGQINQLTKKMDVANSKIVRLEDKNDQLTQELIEARGTIVAMKREMNQMNKDLQVLLRQSTLNDSKRPAASTTSNGQSVASGDETVFS